MIKETPPTDADRRIEAMIEQLGAMLEELTAMRRAPRDSPENLAVRRLHERAHRAMHELPAPTVAKANAPALASLLFGGKPVPAAARRDTLFALRIARLMVELHGYPAQPLLLASAIAVALARNKAKRPPGGPEGTATP